MATNDPERRPAWLERMESGGTADADDDTTSAKDTPVTELPREKSAGRSRATPGAAAHSAAVQLEQTGIARLREEAERAARQDADAGVPDPDSEGQSESERDLRERCRAFYDRWSFQYRRQVHDEVAEHEEIIADRLGRASLAVDRYERLTNELMRVKARR
ncbi:MAG: hypothetical protein R3344_07470, partial [Acidobacteriota bacterium]|nr:hypothetical protein [Acidobacteriota bacterium]